MDPSRFMTIVIGMGGIILIFSFLTYKMLSRKKETLVYVFSLFLISFILACILNIIHFFIVDYSSRLILHLFTNFFNFFGIGFLYITNQIMLKSSLIYTIESRLKYLITYAVILLGGMFAIALLTKGVTFNSEGSPVWNVYFYVFMTLLVYGFSIIPVNTTTIQIFRRSPKGESKKKYIILLIGIIGFSPLPFLVFTSNYLDILMFRTIVAILFMTILIWAYLFYYSLGKNLKIEE
ncbi:MAG: hypothetical protein ACFFC3_11135 [Candidatus Odinarchaeota archaeon]